MTAADDRPIGDDQPERNAGAGPELRPQAAQIFWPIIILHDIEETGRFDLAINKASKGRLSESWRMIALPNPAWGAVIGADIDQHQPFRFFRKKVR